MLSCAINSQNVIRRDLQVQPLHVFDQNQQDALPLNQVFRSIAPQNNNPKNLPVHGLNVIAFARIQTSSNGGFATRRKGRFAPLSRWPAGQP